MLRLTACVQWLPAVAIAQRLSGAYCIMHAGKYPVISSVLFQQCWPRTAVNIARDRGKLEQRQDLQCCLQLVDLAAPNQLDVAVRHLQDHTLDLLDCSTKGRRHVAATAHRLFCCYYRCCDANLTKPLTIEQQQWPGGAPKRVASLRSGKFWRSQPRSSCSVFSALPSSSPLAAAIASLSTVGLGLLAVASAFVALAKNDFIASFADQLRWMTCLVWKGAHWSGRCSRCGAGSGECTDCTSMGSESRWRPRKSQKNLSA